jgi:hypothetical protein
MITDNQARKLMKYLQEKKTLDVAAAGNRGADFVRDST